VLVVFLCLPLTKRCLTCQPRAWRASLGITHPFFQTFLLFVFLVPLSGPVALVGPFLEKTLGKTKFQYLPWGFLPSPQVRTEYVLHDCNCPPVQELSFLFGSVHYVPSPYYRGRWFTGCFSCPAKTERFPPQRPPRVMALR